MMEFIKQLEEAASQIGMVISYIDGEFQDVSFVDWNTQSRFVENMYTKSLISNIREHGDFDDFTRFVAKRYKGMKMGDQYDDTPGAVHQIYGPFLPQDISNLDDSYLYHVGYDREKEGEKFFGKKQWRREREY